MKATRTHVVEEFDGTAAAVGDARAWAVSRLPAGCSRADDVAVVVSELATNAVLHSASGHRCATFRVRLDLAPGEVTISVTDRGAAAASAPRLTDEGGWGLLIVRNLADSYEETVEPTVRTAACRIVWSTRPG
ncbi:Anti-sigma regulatory factor (Ser/Thr protein kinase) [Nonomuraea maritima]|uniref:Anti-sigma regulatory factor (Ser/Thr protein kinase) n=1 Tax=Nonomuraea maritima TaxID=683260 RepID=A0A1G9E3S1_9ACTN|nr:ATP-binding protein [Nonomuraea maritima]SDK70786.1 Anti-sigma regulatory factor (Ser/Thr protein kinase) [Nonomuraea maritima]